MKKQDDFCYVLMHLDDGRGIVISRKHYFAEILRFISRLSPVRVRAACTNDNLNFVDIDGDRWKVCDSILLFVVECFKGESTKGQQKARQLEEEVSGE